MDDMDARHQGAADAGKRLADELRVTLEVGPKAKNVVAVAPNWPESAD
jgi:hypothetical protein